jgi:hypothetical protein
MPPNDAAGATQGTGKQTEVTTTARLELLLKVCTGVLAFISALVLFLQAHLPEWLVWPITALLVVGLAACFAGYLVVRRRAADRRQLRESPFGDHLVPYHEGESLPNREREGKHLASFVTARAAHLYLLSGPSGCGKTSLVRADLSARLACAKISTIYVSAETSDLLTSIRAACARILDVQPAATHDRTLAKLLAETANSQRERFPNGLTIVCDQIEELFLPGRPAANAGGWLHEVWEAVRDSSPKIRVLLVVREAYRPLLMKLRAEVLGPDAEGELDPQQATFPLKHLQEDQARAFLRGSAFSEEVQDRLVTELTGEYGVSPAMLQLVGARLFDHEVFTRKAYRRVNGVTGALASYVEELIETSPDHDAAWSGLRALAAPPADHGPSPSLPPGEVLEPLLAARLLLLMPDGAVVIRDRNVREAIKQALAERRPAVADATGCVRKYVALHEEDSCVRMPLRTILAVQPLASPWALHSREARSLMVASRRASLLRLVNAGGALGLVLVTLGIAAATYLESWYATPAWYPIATIELVDAATTVPYYPTAMALAPDGNLLVLAHNGESRGLYTLDVRWGSWPLIGRFTTLKPIAESMGTDYTALAFGPQGRYFASGGRDGAVRLWGRAALKPDASLRDPAAPSEEDGRSIAYLGFTPNGKYLLAIDESKRTRVWHVGDRKLVEDSPVLTEVLDAEEGIAYVSMGDEGGRIAVMTAPNDAAGKARVVVLRLDETDIDVDAEVEGVHAFDNGTLLAVCATDERHVIVATKRGDTLALEAMVVDVPEPIMVQPMDFRLGRPERLLLARSGQTVGANLAEPIAWMVHKRDAVDETQKTLVYRDERPSLHALALSSMEQTLVLVDGESGTTVYRWTTGYADQPIFWHE